MTKNIWLEHQEHKCHEKRKNFTKQTELFETKLSSATKLQLQRDQASWCLMAFTFAELHFSVALQTGVCTLVWLFSASNRQTNTVLRCNIFLATYKMQLYFFCKKPISANVRRSLLAPAAQSMKKSLFFHNVKWVTYADASKFFLKIRMCIVDTLRDSDCGSMWS